jgi:ketosteroid isomerase-like protein
MMPLDETVRLTGSTMQNLSLAAKALGSLVLLLMAGCQPSGTEIAAPAAVDIEKATAELLEQDMRFAEMAETQGVAEAYRRFMAEDAIQLPDGGLAIGGREAIYADMVSATQGAEFTLTWEPLEAQVAASGELGFTWGVYYFESLDELGAPFVAEGKYVYVWRNTNGRWELILDITNQTEPLYEEWSDEAGEESIEDLSPSELDAGQDLMLQQERETY